MVSYLPSVESRRLRIHSEAILPRRDLDAIAEVRARGAPMTSEIARMVGALVQGTPSESDAGGLTGREAEILTLVAEGLSNKEITQKANISACTVRIHRGHIFKNFTAHCRTEAAAKYLRKK